MAGHYRISKSERVHGNTLFVYDIITMDFKKNRWNPPFMSALPGNRTWQQSWNVAQWQSNCVNQKLTDEVDSDGSNPSVPIRCTRTCMIILRLHHKKASGSSQVSFYMQFSYSVYGTSANMFPYGVFVLTPPFGGNNRLSFMVPAGL